jgi:hypothetical protein
MGSGPQLPNMGKKKMFVKLIPNSLYDEEKLRWLYAY